MEIEKFVALVLLASPLWALPLPPLVDQAMSHDGALPFSQLLT
jgi:hypothetical protein